jgi:very-short-patch-repair endonuclease
VVDAVEAWCELATTLCERDLVVCGDALLRRKGPLATMEEVAAAVDAAPGRPGIRRLRAALSQVRARTDSPMETVLRLALVSAGLPEPAVNYQILGHGGQVAAHGDLVYPEARLVVEYDGEQHRTDARQYHLDVDRLWRIRSLGWEVVRLNKSHLIGHASEAVRRVRLALSSS